MLDRARRDAMLSIGALWVRYFELGGMGTALELEAYLSGALQPSPREYDVLAHTLNERFFELGGDHLIPYSDDEELCDLAAHSAQGAIRHVACDLEFELSTAAILAVQVAAANTIRDVLDEQLAVSLDGETGPPASELATYRGGRMHVIRAEAGRLAISYRASIRSEKAPPPAGTDEAVVDAEAIAALRQSRYCPSDTMAGFAAAELARLERGPDFARQVAAWVFERLQYQPGSSDTRDTAVDTLLAGAGSCRDFAHVAIALCRALGVPARFVAVYAPGLSPMDFHAVVEARRGTGWEVLDPTRLAPRSSLTRIATGRDAADTAFATTLRGEAELMSSDVLTIIDGDLPPDDHIAPVSLA